MKPLVVKKVDFGEVTVEQIPDAMDKNGIIYQSLSEVNWSDYPYQPQVEFGIAHDGQNIYLNFRIEEESIRALHGDNGLIWTDSCVEFFLQFPQDDDYYNLECNCIGSILLGTGADRNRMLEPQEVLNKIERASNLGKEPFDLLIGTYSWNVSLIIPVEVFSKSRITNISGLTMRGNFYKCGDELNTPHFLSWNKIQHPAPNFHLPEFFGDIIFE